MYYESKIPICFILSVMSQHINVSIYSGDMLSRLVEKHADLKGILNEIIFLHNSNTQTLSNDNALVKMAKKRQQK